VHAFHLVARLLERASVVPADIDGPGKARKRRGYMVAAHNRLSTASFLAIGLLALTPDPALAQKRARQGKRTYEGTGRDGRVPFNTMQTIREQYIRIGELHDEILLTRAQLPGLRWWAEGKRPELKGKVKQLEKRLAHAREQLAREIEKARESVQAEPADASLGRGLEAVASCTTRDDGLCVCELQAAKELLQRERNRETERPAERTVASKPQKKEKPTQAEWDDWDDVRGDFEKILAKAVALVKDFYVILRRLNPDDDPKTVIPDLKRWLAETEALRAEAEAVAAVISERVPEGTSNGHLVQMCEEFRTKHAGLKLRDLSDRKVQKKTVNRVEKELKREGLSLDRGFFNCGEIIKDLTTERNRLRIFKRQ